jgi:hypothetical protein
MTPARRGGTIALGPCRTRPAPGNQEETAMRTTRRCLAALLLAATAVAISLAPVAAAKSVHPDPATAPSTPAPAATGGDPAVPDGPTVNFNADNFDGNSLAY